jgi:hypothetical protein
VEIPNLKALHSYPMLFVMALGYVLLLGTVTYLASKRADYIDKERSELTRLLEFCMDKNGHGKNGRG